VQYPEFMKRFPARDIPFPADVFKTHAIRSDAGLVVFFDFLQDVTLPAHSHLAQWGTFLCGQIEMVIGGITKTVKPGNKWDIPADVEHRVRIKAGSKALDVFEAPDRYSLVT